MAVGNFTGKPIYLVASLDGLLAGIMGGICGMLGAMAPPENPVLIVGFMNVVFIVIMLFLLRLIRQETLRLDGPNGTNPVAIHGESTLHPFKQHFNRPAMPVTSK
jgi:hypothetical protein